MFDRKFRQQRFKPFTPLVPVLERDFEDRHDIVFD